MSQTTGMLRRIGRRARANGAPWAVGFFAATAFVAAVVVIQAWPSSQFEREAGSIWVTGGDEAGRLNTQIGQIDHRIPVREDSELFQGGGLVDGRVVAVAIAPAGPDGRRELQALDPGSVTDAEPVVVAGQVGAGGGRTAWLNAGSLSVLSDLDGTATQIDLGVDPDDNARLASLLLAVAEDGTIAVLDGRTLHVVDPGATTSRRLEVEPARDAQLSFVGSRPVLLLDRGTRLVVPESAEVALDPGAAGGRLQLPGPDRPAAVIATRGGVIEVPLDGGDPVATPVAGVSAEPSPPAVDGRCTMVAWGSGQGWGRCGSSELPVQPLGGAPGWSVRAGGGRLVANAPQAPSVWVIDESGAGPRWLEIPWPDDVTEDDQVTEDDYTEPPQNPVQQPPVAVADVADSGPDRRFKARPGRVTRLEVLKNDHDPNGDPISVVEPLDSDAGGRLTVSPDRRAVLLDLPADASPGERIRFEYRINDGRPDGDSAPAAVEVDVVPETVNEPPQRIGPPLAFQVGSGQTTVVDVASRFWDPEGDPFFLRSATEPPGHRVVVDPAGWFTFSAGAPESTAVQFVMSDGEADSPDQASAVVLAVGASTPPAANDDVVVVLEGSRVEVRPLDNDADPLGAPAGAGLRLAAPPEWRSPVDWARVGPDGRTLVLDKPTPPGTYVASYVAIADGRTSDPANLVVHVVKANADVVPLARNDVVVAQPGRSAEVDLVRNDVDAGGALLSVVDLTDPNEPNPPGVIGALRSDYRTFGVDVGLTAEPGTTGRFTYTVSNGRRTSTAEVLVVLQERTNRAPRRLPLDPVRVRAGDVGTVLLTDVLVDDDGDALDYQLTGNRVPGAAFGGNVLRFEVPADAAAGTTFDVEVTARDPDLNRGSATVQFVTATGDENRAPVPRDLEARVRAGATVAIAIPLDEARPPVDPDGDSVQLDGLVAGDEAVNGEIQVDRPRQLIRFTAPEQLAGQQVTLRYRLRDARGEVGPPGLIRIAVLPAPENRKPVARPDRVWAAPGAELSLDPVANDTDLDGDRLQLSDDPVAGCGATVRRPPPELPDAVARVVVTAPTTPGSTCAVNYVVSDRIGDTADGTIEITALEGFPGVPPIARDDIVPPPPRGQADAVVDVLANDVDPDGDTADLQVSGAGLEPVAGGFRVAFTDQPRRLRYEVRDADGLVSVAYVRVPGLAEKLPPQLRPGPPVELTATEVGAPPLVLELEDLIEDPDGGRLEEFELPSVPAQLDAAEARRSVTERRLALRTINRTVEAGVVSLPVRVRDDDGLEATVLITIVIRPAENVDPRWVGSSPCLDVERRREPRQVRLADFAKDDDAPDSPNGTLSFDWSGQPPPGVNVRILDGSILELSAEDTATDGAQATMTLIVTDGSNGRAEAPCTVRVSDYTGPPLGVGALETTVKQGETATVQVGPAVTNVVGGIEIIPGSAGPGIASVRVQGTDLLITADASSAVTTTLRFTVRDPRSRDLRTVDGVVTVKVVGPPGQVASPRVSSPAGQTIDVSWDAPSNGNTEITGYFVEAPGLPKAVPCGAKLSCTLDKDDGVLNGRDYVVSVRAVNDAGLEGPPGAPSETVTPDVPPGPPLVGEPQLSAPTTDPRGTVTFTWVDDQDTNRSAVEAWLVRTKVGDGAWTSPRKVPATSEVVPVDNGTRACIQVAGENGKGAGEYSREVCGTPFGLPIIGQPSVTATAKRTLRFEWPVAPNAAGNVKSWTVNGCNGSAGTSAPGGVVTAELTCEGGNQTVQLLVVNSADQSAGRTDDAVAYDTPVLSGGLTLAAKAGVIEVTGLPTPSQGVGLNAVDRWQYRLAEGTWEQRDQLRGASIPITGYGPRTLQVRGCNGPRQTDPDLNSCSDPVEAAVDVYSDPPDTIITSLQIAPDADTNNPNDFIVSFNVAPPTGTERGDWEWQVGGSGGWTAFGDGAAQKPVSNPSTEVSVRYRKTNDAVAKASVTATTTTTTTTLPSGPN